MQRLIRALNHFPVPRSLIPRLLLLSWACCLLLSGCLTSPPLPADYRDKMAGAWVGKSIGVSYGWPTEFRWKGAIIPEDKMPVWKPELVNETFNQDDLYVQLTFLRTLETRGINVTSREAGIDFANSRYRLWCANHNGRNNLRRGIAAPDSGHPKFHPTPDDIDYQIESDFSGIIAPGMPQVAIDLGNVFGAMMNYGDGLYAGQFIGAMYAYAYTTTDREQIVESALKCIPAESKYAEMVRDMLAWYRADKKDWRGAWKKTVDKYQSKEYIGKVSNPGIDVKINGAMVLLGLLFGDGDIEQTMRIATAGGYDSDCNPSTACGILGCSIGLKNIPKKYYEQLDLAKKWEFTDYNYGELLSVCEKLAKQVVAKWGTSDKVVPNEYVNSFNPKPPLNVLYSEAEMEQIRYAVCEKQGAQSVELRRRSGQRFNFGIKVIGWEDRGGGVFAAKAPEFTESLFVNGRRAQRARYPKEGFFHLTSVSQCVDKVSRTGFRTYVTLPDEAAALFKNADATDLEYAQLIAHIKWDVSRYPFSSVLGNVATLEAEQQKSWKTWATGDQYVIENLRSAFTDPGEWFYDARAKEILYRPLPGENMKSAEVYIPPQGDDTVFYISGNDRDIKDWIVSYTPATSQKGPSRIGQLQAAALATKAAIIVDNATNVWFLNCRFEHTGSYAIWFRNNVKNCGVVDCTFTDLGAGGVRIGPMEQNKDVPASVSHVTVENCTFEHGGRFHPAGVGVFLTHASDCKITHNDIYDFYYTGVSLGWVWGYAGSVSQRNECSFNHIHDIGQRHLADMGGVYTLGTSFGTVISNNVIHGIHSYSYGGWGLYNDEGSEGIVLENNLVYDTDDSSYHQHYGRNNVLRNNVLLDSAKGQFVVTRAEPHRSVTCEHNIILWTKGDAFLGSNAVTKETAKVDYASNCWWRVDGKESFNGTSFKDWCGRVKDIGSVFADPGFADWRKGDISLKSDSPALKLGFKPFDSSLAGRRNFKSTNKGK